MHNSAVVVTLAWKSTSLRGKKHECSTDLKFPLFINQSAKAHLEGIFDASGVGDLQTKKGSSKVIVRDPVTGRMFESLTDNDVYVVPMKLCLVPFKDCHLGVNIRNCMIARVKSATKKDDEALWTAARENVREFITTLGTGHVQPPAESIRETEQVQYDMLRKMQM